tara:strand:+ start:173 stop:577 length:405 start_codon:yes stop_codon:yes gene_type:complete
MKKNKSPLGYRMKHSPLNDNGENEIVNSAGGSQEPITAYGRPVVTSSGEPISQEMFDYYQKQNELYPQYVYNTEGDTPGFRGSDVVSGAIMPKSTSVRHTQDLMSNPDIKFYRKAVDSIMKLPGYEKLTNLKKK